MAALRNLLFILGPKGRPRLVILMVLFLIASLFEALGVGLIYPFIQIIGAPEKIQDYEAVVWLLEYLNWDMTADPIRFFALLLVLVFCVRSGVLISVLYVRNRIIAASRSEMSGSLFESYIRQPHAFHLERNSSELVKNITTTTGSAAMAMTQLSNLAIEALTVFALISVIVATVPHSYVLAYISFGVVAYLLSRALKPWMRKWGTANEDHMKSIITWTTQGLHGAKIAKLLGREQYFINRLNFHLDGLAATDRRYDTTMESPRIILEAILIGGIVAVIVFISPDSSHPEDMTATLGILAAAAMRIMPSANRIVSSINGLRYAAPAIDIVAADFNVARAAGSTPMTALHPQETPLPFENAITLDNVQFSYPGTDRPALRDINLTVTKGESIGIVGGTGAGKSTLLDIFLALHEPHEGSILIDDVDYREAPERWRRNIGYVPQDIYLIDGTIRENIGFGLAVNEISPENLEHAIRLSHALEFIEGLPDGADTIIGERGMRLSGGQRQRLGIARALYDDPEILIFDEATSALDAVTEKEVTDAIREMLGRKTIIVVAHRLSTIRDCDRIYVMENGTITAQGTFQELTENSAEFAKMAKLSKV